MKDLRKHLAKARDTLPAWRFGEVPFWSDLFLSRFEKVKLATRPAQACGIVGCSLPFETQACLVFFLQQAGSVWQSLRRSELVWPTFHQTVQRAQLNVAKHGVGIFAAYVYSNIMYMYMRVCFRLYMCIQQSRRSRWALFLTYSLPLSLSCTVISFLFMSVFFLFLLLFIFVLSHLCLCHLDFCISFLVQVAT